jgi:hypothetical protein
MDTLQSANNNIRDLAGSKRTMPNGSGTAARSSIANTFAPARCGLECCDPGLTGAEDRREANREMTSTP